MNLDALERLARELTDLRSSSLELETTRLLSPKEAKKLSEARTRFHVDAWNAWPSLADAVMRLVAVAKAAEIMRESRWLCAPNHDPEGCPGCMMNIALSALAKSEGGG